MSMTSMPTRSRIAMLLIVAPAMRPGEGLGDEVGDVCEASETLGSVEEEGADVKKVEICEAEE
jgi:hypothetical protein